MNATAMGAERVRGDNEGKRAARRLVVGGLQQLLAAVPELIGAIVASVDGLPLAHSMREGDPAGLAAMAATAAGLGKHLVEDQALGAFAESVVRGELGYFAVYSAGSQAVLAVIASDGANLGRVHLQARRCAMTIASALEEAAR